jgi:hypothetical protein
MITGRINQRVMSINVSNVPLREIYDLAEKKDAYLSVDGRRGARLYYVI